MCYNHFLRFGVLDLRKYRRDIMGTVKIDTQHLQQCIHTLELSIQRLESSKPNSDDYGIAFVNTTLHLLPQFLIDAKKLVNMLDKKTRSSHA